MRKLASWKPSRAPQGGLYREGPGGHQRAGRETPDHKARKPTLTQSSGRPRGRRATLERW